MLKFFRKIRKSLIDSGSTRRYLIYAAGEILLVMIGILLALQINNWNEGRKNKIKAETILVDIKNDMLEDIDVLDSLLSLYETRLKYFNRFDASFDPGFEYDRSELDTVNLFDYEIMSLMKSYRANTSSYDAMVSDGNSDLLTNRGLFAKIQQIYKDFVPSHLGIYEHLRIRQGEISFKWSYIKRFQPYQYIADVTDEHFISDMNYYIDQIKFYYERIKFIQQNLKEVTKEIEEDLGQG